MRKIFLSALVLLFILTPYYIIHNTAFAQNANAGINLTLNPTFMDITANPGDVLKEKFRIRNNTDQPLQLSIIVDKLDPHTRNGEVVPVKPQANDPSVTWITLDNQSPTANPREWIDIPFSINVPKTAAFGYYYALRIGPSQTSNQQNGATTKLLAQIVLPVLLNVTSPNAKAELKLLSFSPTSYFNEYLPITFQVKFQNTGNVHIKPSGSIFIHLSDGTSDAVNLNPESGIILPGGIRTFQPSWDNGFIVMKKVYEDGVIKTDKNGKIVTHLVFNPRLSNFRIGRYTANLIAVYDNGKRDIPIEATTTFWVFPWKVVGIVLFLIIIVGISLLDYLHIRFLQLWGKFKRR